MDSVRYNRYQKKLKTGTFRQKTLATKLMHHKMYTL